MSECRKCGKTLSGMAADHAHQGGDRLCGVTSCHEESAKCYEPLPVPYETKLRDRFAGLAMQAMIAGLVDSGSDYIPTAVLAHRDNKLHPTGEIIAQYAYEYADFMMKARKQ